MMVVHVKNNNKASQLEAGLFSDSAGQYTRTEFNQFSSSILWLSLILLDYQQHSVGRKKKILKQKHGNRKLYGAQQKGSYLFKMPLASENVMKSLAHNFFILFFFLFAFCSVDHFEETQRIIRSFFALLWNFWALCQVRGKLSFVWFCVLTVWSARL